MMHEELYINICLIALLNGCLDLETIADIFLRIIQKMIMGLDKFCLTQY
jgi:hypothetical protein